MSSISAFLIRQMPALASDPPAGTEQTQVLSGLVLLGIIVFWLVIAAVFLLVINRVLRRASPPAQHNKMTQREDDDELAPTDPWIESARRTGPLTDLPSHDDDAKP